jgi:hypothetical protein
MKEYIFEKKKVSDKILKETSKLSLVILAEKRDSLLIIKHHSAVKKDGEIEHVIWSKDVDRQNEKNTVIVFLSEYGRPIIVEAKQEKVDDNLTLTALPSV